MGGGLYNYYRYFSTRKNSIFSNLFFFVKIFMILLTCFFLKKTNFCVWKNQTFHILGGLRQKIRFSDQAKTRGELIQGWINVLLIPHIFMLPKSREIDLKLPPTWGSSKNVVPKRKIADFK